MLSGCLKFSSLKATFDNNSLALSIVSCSPVNKTSKIAFLSILFSLFSISSCCFLLLADENSIADFKNLFWIDVLCNLVIDRI